MDFSFVPSESAADQEYLAGFQAPVALPRDLSASLGRPAARGPSFNLAHVLLRQMSRIWISTTKVELSWIDSEVLEQQALSFRHDGVPWGREIFDMILVVDREFGAARWEVDQNIG